MYECIFCIFACDTIPKYKNQILKIVDTWGKIIRQYNLKLIFFLGEEVTDLVSTHDSIEYIHLPNVKNDYMSASYKQYKGLEYIHDHYQTKYVFCCGTDTYINVHKLVNYLKRFTHTDKLYIGGDGNIRCIDKELYYHSGGPGFILSSELLKILYPIFDKAVETWIEICRRYNVTYLIPACDASISYYIQMDGIDAIIVSETDLSFRGCNYLGNYYSDGLCLPCHINTRYDNIISCHFMTEEDFDAYTTILEKNNYFIIQLPNPIE